MSLGCQCIWKDDIHVIFLGYMHTYTCTMYTGNGTIQEYQYLEPLVLAATHQNGIKPFHY